MPLAPDGAPAASVPYDLALIGSGVAPALVALQLARRWPHLALLVLTSDALLGGGHPELLFPDRLDAQSRAMIDPAIVREWTGFTLIHAGESRPHAETVAMVDPVQLGLELETWLPAGAIRTGCRDITVAGQAIGWQGGKAAALTVIPLPSAGIARREDTIVSAGWLAGLTEPVAADYDAAGGEWTYLQYLPLGGDLTLMASIREHPAPPARPDEPALPASALALTDLIARIGALPGTMP